MKFKLNRTGKRLAIPDHVTRISGLSDESALEIHAIDSGIVITKAQMTAMDIITLTTALQDMASDFHVHIAEECGMCDECGLCAAFDEDDDTIILPPHILEETQNRSRTRHGGFCNRKLRGNRHAGRLAAYTGGQGL